MTVKRILSWTINSINQQQQDIQRSLNGGEFITIATLPADANTYVDSEDYSVTTGVEYRVVSSANINGTPISAISESQGIRPVFTEWTLTTEPTYTGGVGQYSAVKTNQYVTYESNANIDLTTAVTRSLHDADMQQWQAVKDACNELTGVVNWIVDTPNAQIRYTEITDPNLVLPNYLWTSLYITNRYPYIDSVDYAESICRLNVPEGRTFRYVMSYSSEGFYCSWSMGSDYFNKEVNQNYNPDGGVHTEKYVSFSTVAQKIISNVSSTDEATSLLAQIFVETVTKSINQTDVSKQFVKPSDLANGFEANKTIVGV